MPQYKRVPLISDNLQLPQFQQPSMTSSAISSFVSEQKRYQKHYATEGAAAFKSWISVSCGGKGDGTNGSRLSASAKAMCNSSPLLQPRVPEPPISDTRGSSSRKNYRQIVIPKTQSGVYVPQPRGPEELREDDHVARLQQRRERRRAKRAVLHPKPPLRDHIPDDSASPAKTTEFSSLSSGDQQGARRSRKKREYSTNRGKAKASKKRMKKSSSSGSRPRHSPLPTQRSPRKRRRSKNIAPGLSLMHNFDAKNIARSRITLNKIGVFNKGVASAPTNVPRNGIIPQEKLLAMFSRSTRS
ncbi:uncharacterized protein EI90DRAFT_1294377 [Cantharellus anzutake]|uniref:uncharacterized protein n=1 Tax=Cantharellus anzutake TaxID=1750568 RepID=UPI00190798C7|nr:uncharacterized protein EI90DRAFT_1294377 [Cantharellus anzutake]KAF8342008.1 hypothetical protein EI90DRAFT_1294377 [Cantharellus anzutake]